MQIFDQCIRYFAIPLLHKRIDSFYLFTAWYIQRINAIMYRMNSNFLTCDDQNELCQVNNCSIHRSAFVALEDLWDEVFKELAMSRLKSCELP